MPWSTWNRTVRNQKLFFSCGDTYLFLAVFNPFSPGGLVGGPRAYYQDQFRGFKSHRVHARGIFLLKINWLAESAREWVTYIHSMKIDEQWENAELYARQKIKARTWGEKVRHLWPRLVRKLVEGKNLPRVRLESKSDAEKRIKKMYFTVPSGRLNISRWKLPSRPVPTS